MTEKVSVTRKDFKQTRAWVKKSVVAAAVAIAVAAGAPAGVSLAARFTGDARPLMMRVPDPASEDKGARASSGLGASALMMRVPDEPASEDKKPSK
jgi:hypothetical protein